MVYFEVHPERGLRCCSHFRTALTGERSVKNRQGRGQRDSSTARRLRTDLEASRPRSSSPSTPARAVSTTLSPDSPAKLGQLLCQRPERWRERNDWQTSIAREVLEQSTVMDGENFRKIARQDLERMAEAYDQYFFGGLCLAIARSYGMSFRLSSRMSRAGGKTTRQTFRAIRNRPAAVHYEIALSTSLLFQSFRKPGDRTRVCGMWCDNRLAAMQRIVEHEMIHLCEMLVWIHSDCAASRFQTMAHRMFGHTEHRHELITQQERAARDFNIKLGRQVVFRVNNQNLIGVVNRITSRATVLVPDPKGRRYSDGTHYAKYYVPLDQLRPVD